MEPIHLMFNYAAGAAETAPPESVWVSRFDASALNDEELRSFDPLVTLPCTRGAWVARNGHYIILEPVDTPAAKANFAAMIEATARAYLTVRKVDHYRPR